MAGESELEKKISLYAADKGCYVRKFTSHHVGVPDRIIAKHGITLFLEVKDFGKRPSGLQKDEMGIITRTGGFATWVDNWATAKELIDLVVKSDTRNLYAECQHLNYWMF